MAINSKGSQQNRCHHKYEFNEPEMFDTWLLPLATITFLLFSSNTNKASFSIAMVTDTLMMWLVCHFFRSQSYVDYSYQDDFVMEDVTAPDTMINFSEVPQQPNYYQCPQTAGDNLNLGFNMSLQPNSQPGFAPVHPPTGIPPAHQQQNNVSLPALQALLMSICVYIVGAKWLDWIS